MTQVATTNSTLLNDPKEEDNTKTFLIGFGVLLIFVIIGVLASAFLCLTLKKDQYLWEAETQLQEKRSCVETGGRGRDKLNIDESCDSLSFSK